MQEPQRKNLARKLPALQNSDATQSALAAKRTRLEANQTPPPSILNLSRHSLLPAPVPIAKPIAKPIAIPVAQARYANVQDQLEESDSENELTMQLARLQA